MVNHKDSIEKACRLYFQVDVPTWSKDEETAQALETALSEDSPAPRLFVAVGGEGGQQMLLASTEKPPASSFLLFILTKHQLQTITFLGQDADSSVGSSSYLQLLQIFTKQGLIPTIQSLDQPELTEKARALDLALQQSSRSAKIPHVVLQIHPTIQEAAPKYANKLDWDHLGLSACLENDELLNELQSNVSSWISQIQSLSALRETEFDGQHELVFWSQLKEELDSVQAHLESSPGVLITVGLLREAKRFVATVALENNTGLADAQTYAQDVNTFLQGFPVQQLQAAVSMDQVAQAMNAIMDHFPKIRQSRYYSLERACSLLVYFSSVLRDSLLHILVNDYKNILFMDYKEYENNVRFPSMDVFNQFEDRFGEWKAFMLEQARRRKQTGMHKAIDKISLQHEPLKARLEQVHEFRASHEKLRQVVHQILREEEPAAIQQVEQAPRQIFGRVNVLELSPDGEKELNLALEDYDIQIDTLEERLAKLLKDRLEACQDAEDMFRVFARFNLLLTRTRVRAAVKEFQIQLISTVAQAVEKLQSKFSLKYEASPAAKIARLRGIPPVSGKILWAKQMERQVHTLMERMGNVLGPDWGLQLEGRQLRKSGDELMAKLDAKSFFRNWVQEWERELTMEATSKLSSFPILIETEGKDNVLVPSVNFDEKKELLAKEIRHLRWLGFGQDIPKTLTLVSEESSSRYPYAVAIKTAIRSYLAVRKFVTTELEPLVLPQLIEIRECFSEAFDAKLSSSTVVAKKRRIRWDSKEMDEWVARLSESVTKFEDRVEQLLVACDKVDIALNLLERVDYDEAKFRGVLSTVQKTIDNMSLSGFDNLEAWVIVVCQRMRTVLSNRLENALRAWISFLSAPMHESNESDSLIDKTAFRLVDGMKLSVEIVLRNQEITTIPAMPKVRSIFLDVLHRLIGVVCDLPLPTSGRYEVFDEAASNTLVNKFGSTSFDSVVDLLSPDLLRRSYILIEDHISKASSFVDRWLSYQTLWDTQVSDISSLIGSDIDKWYSLLVEASDARNTLDSSDTKASFGEINVVFGKIQSQINLKYDSWQKELQASFASVLDHAVSELHAHVLTAKDQLEKTSLDGAATESIVLGVTLIQDVRKKATTWKADIESLRSCEKLLRKQRFVFHSDWFETSVLKGLFDSLLQILDRRARGMEQQIPVLQTRVTSEDKAALKKTEALVNSWCEERPLRGNIDPPLAIEILNKFEVALSEANVHQTNLSRAKDALGLPGSSGSTTLMESLNELSDLKEVWEALLGPFELLQSIKNTVWASAVVRKIKSSLDELLASMRSLPNRIRQYDPYIQLHENVKALVGGHGVLLELKTEALKDRHWHDILQRIGINTPLQNLTVGTLWDHGILDRKKDIHEVLTTAQGEMAIEVFLGQVRDRWTSQELDLVLFQNRTRLIRGWDELFSTLDDHIGGLALMKGSPYYSSVSEFQEEGKVWEDRLTRLREAFDAWVDVQRRWVYLEGILFSSSDIKAQLPSEWSRFKSVDSEFISLMRRIAGKPYAMEVLNIENLQRTLDRLSNLMTVIQKALGEYLSKQRRDFSRFYFLGDDDLLEIMGNAGEPGKVLPHVGKMFAGIAAARITKSSVPEGVKTRFDAMISKDGEVVDFYEPIDITEEKSVKDWLKELESKMQTTLALLLQEAVSSDSFTTERSLDDSARKEFVEWVKKFPAQVMILATQVNWSMSVDSILSREGSQGLNQILSVLEWKLEAMAMTVLEDLAADTRKKSEQLITELVRQRDVIRGLVSENVRDSQDFRWLYHLRYRYNPSASTVTQKLSVSLSNATFSYGFEYLGIGERLVQTPLTDKCFLTLTQALHFRMGGNPFGPAGTGKTESVKALGAALGRFVLVFNCDETFDFKAMGRLLAGLSQVGAWGCFDEFNRLEERILSAVSQQILTIQRGLLDRKERIDLIGETISLHENVGIFITMNPGYEGRSNLPDNLKNLFRSFAMVVPDRKLIAQVMLYSQGIVTAEQLSGKIVDLFLACEAKLSKQRHYDFGLRALKTLLVSAGGLKRDMIAGSPGLGENLAEVEKDALVRGACHNVVPKLVEEDVPIFASILAAAFPGSSVADILDELSKSEIMRVCEEQCLVAGESFVQKILQLKQIVETRHGIMVVGGVGVGKSSVINVLFQVLATTEKRKGELYRIEPKALTKERLYGSLDGTTLEWTDGVFTEILRKIIENQKGESEKRHWIVFDGDVDPNWVENLNSVLDDNKLLTLPSGERLELPPNVRVIIEVDSLAHATPATVSRCGMLWLNHDTVSTQMRLYHLFESLGKENMTGNETGQVVPDTQLHVLQAMRPLIIDEGGVSLAAQSLEFAMSGDHVMKTSQTQLFCTLRSLLIQGIILAIEYDETHPDFPISGDHLEKFAKRWVLHSLMWSFGGSSSWDTRKRLSEMLIQTSGVILPSSDHFLFDYQVRVSDGEFELWSESVPRMEIESHRVAASDVVITTTDTVRHSDVLSAWLGRRMPLLLCGPPGSGKTMTLTNVLQSIQGVILASLNFSSRTSPEVILKTFSQYCSYVRRGRDVYLEPSGSYGSASWLVVFCDEINLPEADVYGTQRVIMFMRQLVEHGGFWRSDNVWVKINRIQFVGACNPPTDAGRVRMSDRFLRHVPLLFVDFPARDSLFQIYRTFNSGMMKLFPNLKGETDAMTEAMVEVYLENQAKFRPQDQPQYFYSPRELSRWVRGIYESIVHSDSGLTKEELVRVWAHEALRLFSDRLVGKSEKEWCSNLVDSVAQKWFAGVDFSTALEKPILFTTWLSKETRQVSRNDLKMFVGARLRVFYEEMLDVPLVVFDEVLDHVLRIDRVLRQPMGHMLLVGDSGAGKTVLSKFVSWMNGLNIFQIKAHSRYGMDDFNEDLRVLMRRVGVEGEKICFIFDESNILSSGFIEAINALLASGEVPGLFEGDDYSSLMTAVRDSAIRDGMMIDTEEDLWRHFTQKVQRNLHVVFTINPSGGDWKNRSTTSPALFNRCVVDWFGSWGKKAMGDVAKEFTLRLDVGEAELSSGTWGIGEGQELMDAVKDVFDDPGRGGFRHAVIAALVAIHECAKDTSEENAMLASSNTRTYLSPRDYLALIHNFVSTVRTRRDHVEQQQLHVNAGLEKLRQTKDNVEDLKKGLGEKTSELKNKEAMANDKLQQMVAEQNEAERKKENAERLGAELAKQQSEINRRKESAQRDLNEAEPALRDAQASVKGIKKRDLDEIKNLARPPNNVKLTLECVAIMLGETSIEWSDVRKILARNDFIPSIIDFDADKLSSKQIKSVQENYLDGNPDLNAESVTRSSKACGPLYKWAESQIKYSTIYNSIQPLREEVAQLEREADAASEEKAKVEEEVVRLEESIIQYKNDYASLIRDVEGLKREMDSVSTKIARAESLLKSLSHESVRWSKSSEAFESIMNCMIGDCLLMAAFVTYAGFFDFKTRLSMVRNWKTQLERLDLEFRPELPIVETLSTASQRLAWEADGLLPDSLSLENGVILENSERFPLVIDPSGHTMDFIMSKHKKEKVQRTSFLDKSFTKTLSNAVRFGTVLLVENVETIDPILNPILNKEIQRTGGRSLVRIGTEEIDYSPNFRIILSTKNPAIRLTPDVCSRVTIVNFTVTPDSLQSQSLSRLVNYLKPELEEKRLAVIKLQSEQNVKLRGLEDQMLAKISACEGSILDDDRVVEGMELLMKEGALVEEQLSKSDEIMSEVQHALKEFEPLAGICRKIFVLLQSLRELSFLYEFTGKHFMQILETVLGNYSTSGEASTESIRRRLFEEIAAQIGRGLKEDDKIVLSLLLIGLEKGETELSIDGLESSEELITKITENFDKDFPWHGRGLNQLQAVTLSDVQSHTPLLLCSAPGHDVSGRVEAMARELNKQLDAVAMGSSEGYELADSYLTQAMKRGTWVMLKNVHLCIDWLRDRFVKHLQGLGSNTHKDFRIFITSDINPSLPASLLQISDVIVAEAPSGIHASMSRFFAGIQQNRFHSPVLNRLYLLLAWTHAVIQERLRYIPDGWSEPYEFSEADAIHALDVIDSLVDSGNNLDPEKLPWDAIRSTMIRSVFGGRITAEVDQTILTDLVSSLFQPQSFNVDFALSPVSDGPVLPESTTREACLDWISKLPSHSPPTWIGLEASAEKDRELRFVQSVKDKVGIVRKKADSE